MRLDSDISQLGKLIMIFFVNFFTKEKIKNQNIQSSFFSKKCFSVLSQNLFLSKHLTLIGVIAVIIKVNDIYVAQLS